jgi:hypothetical protein
MTEHSNSQREEDAIPAQVSPELALVDPQLGDLVRKRLRSQGPTVGLGTRGPQYEYGDQPRAGAESGLELGAIARSPIAEDGQLPAGAGSRRRRLFATTALVSLAVGAAALAIVAQEVGDVGGSILPRSAQPAVRPTKPTQLGPPSALPTRVFIWPAVSRATFYKVEFFRSNRKIFVATPSMPRIELPLRWVFRGRDFRLTRGTYRWEVRPAFGPRSRPRYGNLITQSMWTPQR